MKRTVSIGVVLAPFVTLVSFTTHVWGWPFFWISMGAVCIVMTFSVLLLCLWCESNTDLFVNLKAREHVASRGVAMLKKAFYVLWTAGSISMIVSFIVAGQEGGVHSDRPVMPPQEEYTLSAGTELTPVSQTRYRVVGVSTLLAYHLFMLGLNSICVHYRITGQFPVDLGGPLRTTDNASPSTPSE